MSQAALSSGRDYTAGLRSYEEQAAAFAAARTHSRRVRLAKRAIVLGSAGFVLLAIGYAIFDPFANLPKDVSVAHATLSGTKITMEFPRLSGFRKDGRPYQLLARSGVQDVRNPKVITLHQIDATIKISDADTLKVTAPAGRFDSGADLMKMTTDKSDSKIRLRGSTYSITLNSADVNFKAGTVLSEDPVSVTMNNGAIQAKGLKVEDNGKRIVFIGDVRSVIRAPAAKGQ